MNKHLRRTLLALPLTLVVASCMTPYSPYLLPAEAAAAGYTTGTTPSPDSTDQGPKLYEWVDDGGPGEVSIRINRSSNIASFTRGGRNIGWSYVATGTPGFRTPTGSFSITEMKVEKFSNRYGWIEDAYGNTVDHDARFDDPVPPGCRYVPAPMPYWMRLTSAGIGMHAGHIPQPGYPASHGCIRLPKKLAPTLFDTVRVGTPVTIY